MPEPSVSNFVGAASIDDNTSLGGDQTNLKQLTLDTSMDGSVTTVSVTEDISSINVPCYILIEQELVYATAKGGGDFTSCIRGAGGTSNVSHTSPKTIYASVIGANIVNQLKRAIIAIENAIGVSFGFIHAATAKSTPVDADEFPISDSAASNVVKKTTFGQLKAFLKTYFDTLYTGGTGSGSPFWTTQIDTPVRTSNTTFTITNDYTNIFRKGLIIKWEEGGVVKFGMVSIPSTYGAPNTTVTIIGNTMTSIDSSSLKYAAVGVEVFSMKFALAGTLGATGTDVANDKYAEEPLVVLGADLQHGTAGVTTTFIIDINKNGTTMFTTKPSLATTVASSPTPFTADNSTTLALGDRVSVDIDQINTGTIAVDLYVTLYVFPARYQYLV